MSLGWGALLKAQVFRFVPKLIIIVFVLLKKEKTSFLLGWCISSYSIDTSASDTRKSLLKNV